MRALCGLFGIGRRPIFVTGWFAAGSSKDDRGNAWAGRPIVSGGMLPGRSPVTQTGKFVAACPQESQRHSTPWVCCCHLTRIQLNSRRLVYPTRAPLRFAPYAPPFASVGDPLTSPSLLICAGVTGISARRQSPSELSYSPINLRSFPYISPAPPSYCIISPLPIQFSSFVEPPTLVCTLPGRIDRALSTHLFSRCSRSPS